MARLVETKTIVQSGEEEPIRFAALSYCWGPPIPKVTDHNNGVSCSNWSTTQANVDARLVELDCEGLPATLRDAVKVAKKQNQPRWAASMQARSLRLLWLPTHPSARQASTRSLSPVSNLLNLTTTGWRSTGRWRTGARPLYISRTPISYFDAGSCSPTMYYNQIGKDPLAERAWTFQEELLSRRILYYTSAQLMWKCTHCVVNEENSAQWEGTGSLYTEFKPDKFPEHNAQRFDILWSSLVVDYSRRKLTKRSDKLVAIGALAKVMYLNRRVEYIAGL